MFLRRNKKNNVHPCKPQFYYIKVGFKGVKIIKACFRDDQRDREKERTNRNISQGRYSKHRQLNKLVNGQNVNCSI